MFAFLTKRREFCKYYEIHLHDVHVKFMQDYIRECGVIYNMHLTLLG